METLLAHGCLYTPVLTGDSARRHRAILLEPFTPFSSVVITAGLAAVGYYHSSYFSIFGGLLFITTLLLHFFCSRFTPFYLRKTGDHIFALPELPQNAPKSTHLLFFQFPMWSIFLSYFSMSAMHYCFFPFGRLEVERCFDRSFFDWKFPDSL